MTTTNPADSGTPLAVMTYNVYIGADLKPVLLASTDPEFDAAVRATLAALDATNMPARARALAREIAAADPELIGLQEVVVWQRDGHDSLDFLALLLDALTTLDVHYQPLVVAPAAIFDAPVAPVVHFTYRNVILARRSSTAEQIMDAHVQFGTFNTNLIIHNPRLGAVSITRGWAAATINLGATHCHFVTVHLEDSDAIVQGVQANELIEALGTIPDPLILVGDFNAVAQPDSSTYAKFLAAGFRDVWAELWPDLPGSTCCQPVHLQNPISTLATRIDWILVRGAVDLLDAFVVGDDASSRTLGALWPSDHAGVVAKLGLH